MKKKICVFFFALHLVSFRSDERSRIDFTRQNLRSLTTETAVRKPVHTGFFDQLGNK